MGALLAGSWRHPRGPEPTPRSMEIIIFQKNERHAAWERSCRSRAPKISQEKKLRFFINNVDFSLEKCRFGAHRGVLHYVLR